MINEFKQARTLFGITQKKMADELGIHVDTLGKWERGEQKPPAIALTALRLYKESKNIS
jgi:DNA-binding transcriptional regulator YiaG